MFLWTALLLGLGGSLHCVGMCGPIAMALPLTSRERRHVFFQSLYYHLGRVSTYALLGFFFGWLGWGIALTGLQKSFSIALGILLLLSALFSISLENQLFRHSLFQKFLNTVKTKLARALSIKNNSSAYKIGLLNGILPCGLVYVALAGAVASGDHWSGAMYMAAFGLGTLPLMLGIMVSGQLSKSLYRRLRRLIPLGLAFFGLLLIYRGLVLVIPEELSFWESTNFQLMCH